MCASESDKCIPCMTHTDLIHRWGVQALLGVPVARLPTVQSPPPSPRGGREEGHIDGEQVGVPHGEGEACVARSILESVSVSFVGDGEAG